MSHFTVLVIGEDVDGQLAPFHEFECTGHNDEYVKDVDQTAEARAEYETHTTLRWRRPDGTLVDLYDDCFYRDLTPEEAARVKADPLRLKEENRELRTRGKDWGDGRGYIEKVHFKPDGYVEENVPAHELQTFAEFVADWYGRKIVRPGESLDLAGEHKYGYCRVDEQGEVVEVIDRTNPNAKWDWYQIGGRWAGMFLLKRGALSGALGEVSPFTKRLPDYQPPRSDTADQALKGDIDFDGMRDESEKNALALYDKIHAVIAGRPIIPWSEFLKRKDAGELTIEEARTAYHNQQPLVDLRRSEDRDVKFIWDIEDYLIPRDQFAARARRRAIRTYAVVKDGQWYERGKMGWWGMSHDEMSEDEWDQQFTALVESLPDDTLLTVVDCHI